MLLIEEGMRVALPVYSGRISPVFDVATHMRVVDIDDGTVIHTRDLCLAKLNRIARLEELGVDVLICGAISRPLEAACWVAGIEVVSEICGPADDVIGAYLNGSLAAEDYRSPGRGDLGHDLEKPIRLTGQKRMRRKARAGRSPRRR
jgi:predicted Fe-Mo cluster-binding NifX family protein